MSEFFSPYDADRPLMLKCSCGRDHTVADHHAEVSADAAAATLRQRSETREFELYSNEFIEATLVKAIFPHDEQRRRFLRAVGKGTAMAAIFVASIPLFSMVIAQVWGLERITQARVVGLVLGTIGILMLVGYPAVPVTGAFLLGTPALSGIGAIGAALTLGLRGGGVLLSLLVLPLYIPVLIFGAGAVDATVTGLGGEGHLSLLAALTFASLGFAPWASAAALKIALE